MVLGALIERVSVRSYEDYVRQHILAPLGMNDTDFVHKPNMVANEATGSHHPCAKRMHPPTLEQQSHDPICLSTAAYQGTRQLPGVFAVLERHRA